MVLANAGDVGASVTDICDEAGISLGFLSQSIQFQHSFMLTHRDFKQYAIVAPQKAVITPKTDSIHVPLSEIKELASLIIEL